MDNQVFRTTRTFLISLAVVVAMAIGGAVLQPMALAILLAFILDPFAQWIQRRGVPRLAAVALTMILAFATLGGLGYVGGSQIMTLAGHLPTYRQNLQKKFNGVNPSPDSPLGRLAQAADLVNQTPTATAPGAPTGPIRVITEPTPMERAQQILAPFRELLAWVGIVAFLLFFLLYDRDDLQSRIIQVLGQGQISLTTKTLAQIGKRLSSYLSTMAAFNISFGVVIGLGLWAIGLPYAALWGVVAGLLRFIPYLGPMLAFALASIFALASVPGWHTTLLVLLVYSVAELAANVLETFIYNKSTGISSFGLLVAALFWWWLWGPLGLLLSIPLTVCLIVVGEYVPGLRFITMLLGEKVQINTDALWYQKVLSRDHDGAIALLDESMKSQSLDRVMDEIVLPGLARAEEDHERGLLEEKDMLAISRNLSDWVDELPHAAPSTTTAANGRAPAGSVTDRAASKVVVGVSTGGLTEELILRVVGHTLEPFGVNLQMIESGDSPLKVSDQLVEMQPDAILISHLPTVGVTRARFLIRRVRARLEQTPLVVGYWSAAADLAEVSQQFQAISNCRTVLDVASCREALLEQLGLVAPAQTPAMAGAS